MIFSRQSKYCKLFDHNSNVLDNVNFLTKSFVLKIGNELKTSIKNKTKLKNLYFQSELLYNFFEQHFI